MSAHNPTEEKLLKMYNLVGMGTCSTCSNCHRSVAKLSPPVSAWGVGKNARGYFEQPANGNFHETFNDGPLALGK